MREIKFRAWIKPESRWADDNDLLVIKLNGELRWENFYAFQAEQPRNIILMQYTGLVDREGKEIWEGDILSVPYVSPVGGLDLDAENGRYAVAFEFGRFVLLARYESESLNNGCRRTKGEYISNYGCPDILSNETVFTVIGNIYENAELLKPANA